MEEKIVISLISVVVGWLLAQGTAFAKDYLATWKLKKGLSQELVDVKEQMQRVIMLYARQLQVFAHKGIEPATPIPVYSLFFKQYYKDVFSRLNRAQCLSYQLIHAGLDTLNKENEDFARAIRESYRELMGSKDSAAINRAVELWGDRVISLYKNAMDIVWHVEYHLKHPKKPIFDIMGPMHRSYLEFQQQLDHEVKEIIEKAKNLKREDFEKLYDERFFQPPNNTT